MDGRNASVYLWHLWCDGAGPAVIWYDRHQKKYYFRDWKSTNTDECILYIRNLTGEVVGSLSGDSLQRPFSESNLSCLTQEPHRLISVEGSELPRPLPKHIEESRDGETLPSVWDVVASYPHQKVVEVTLLRGESKRRRKNPESSFFRRYERRFLENGDLFSWTGIYTRSHVSDSDWLAYRCSEKRPGVVITRDCFYTWCAAERRIQRFSLEIAKTYARLGVAAKSDLLQVCKEGKAGQARLRALQEVSAFLTKSQ